MGKILARTWPLDVHVNHLATGSNTCQLGSNKQVHVDMPDMYRDKLKDGTAKVVSLDLQSMVRAVRPYVHSSVAWNGSGAEPTELIAAPGSLERCHDPSNGYNTPVDCPACS